MKLRSILLFSCLITLASSLSAFEIGFDFDDGDGLVDFNDFGKGVVVSDWFFDVDGGSSAYQNGRAEAGMRDDGAAPTPHPVMGFSVTIPADVTVDLTSLAFDHGFNETFHPNAKTPEWSLVISTGSASPDNGSLPTLTAAGYVSEDETLALSGLTGLTDTTVTFEFTFTIAEGGNNSLSRAHTMDDVVLTGTSSAAPAKAVTYDFDAGNGEASSNTFGVGIVAGPVVLNSTGGTAFDGVVHTSGDPSGGTDPKARIGARKESLGGATMSFTVQIPSNVMVDLTGLSFEHGIDFNGADMTPLWSLSIDNGGSASPVSGDLGLQTEEGFASEDETLVLSGLSGLTDTTVTFTFDFTQEERANTVSIIANTLDDLVLTGSVSVISDPLPSIASFDVDDRSVDSGDTVTLSWTAGDFDTLSIDQGVGDVTSQTTDGSGSTQVVVNADALYTLTATNTAGDVTATRQVRLRPTKPNVLVVLIDDMGTEDTSVDFNYDAAGNPVDRVDPTSVGLPAFTTDNRHFITPHMESLAANGMKFSRAYACQVCSPTRVTLMTGQNSSRHGTIQYIGGGGNLHNLSAPSNGSLKSADRTLAEVMRDNGYRTIVAGKGHMGNSFNSSAGNYKTPAAPVDDYYGFQVNVSASTNGQQGSCYSNAANAFGLSPGGTTGAFVSEYQNMTYHDLDPVAYPVGHALATEPVFVTEALTQEMNERIEDSVDEGLPFLAYLSHFAVHDPHQPDPRFTANYPGLSGDVLDFATMIEGIDQSLGDVIAKLDKLGVAEDTLVIFLGDNGSDSKPRGPSNPRTLSMTNPLRGEKGNCYEGGVRIPLIVAWAKPDGANNFQTATPVSQAAREHDIVSVQDLYPTILSVAGLPVPMLDDGGAPLLIDGVDLTPYLNETPGVHREQRLVTHAPCSSRSSFFTTYHEGDWKLIYYFNHGPDNNNPEIQLGTYELFNLATDLHEANDLSASEPDRLMRMARDLVELLEERGAPYPVLRAADAGLASLGLPSSAGSDHPVILPALAGTDLDGDGLDDIQEDPNRNGLVDPGETSPDETDTDGDRTDDGSELRLGTDPLDGSSFFLLRGQPSGTGTLILTWPSAPGLTFDIHGSTDLIHWDTLVADDLPAADAPAASTSFEVPASAGEREFFRVELN